MFSPQIIKYGRLKTASLLGYRRRPDISFFAALSDN
jgi:hypothetical protein